MYKNIQKRADGSFVVEKNGMPYHVPNTEEFKDEYELIESYWIVHPEKVADYVEPVMEMSEQDERLVRLGMLESEANALFQDITAEIASDEDKARFKKLRREIKALKEEINEG